MIVAPVGLLLVIATLAWLLSLRLRDASIADIGWGPALAVLAWSYGALYRPPSARAALAAALVTAWAVRLAAHIFSRHAGEDFRYRAMRQRYGPTFWWKSLFVVFWLQAGLAWLVSFPLHALAANPGPERVTASDVIGGAVFAAGLAIEAIADAQLRRFRRDPRNRGGVLDTGLWRYTRHPNYFGDALVWWGVYLLALAAPGGWKTAASPALMTWLLVRVSGVAMLEPALTASRPGYAEYVARTSAFVPWRPRRTGAARDS